MSNEPGWYVFDLGLSSGPVVVAWSDDPIEFRYYEGIGWWHPEDQSDFRGPYGSQAEAAQIGRSIANQKRKKFVLL